MFSNVKSEVETVKKWFVKYWELFRAWLFLKFHGPINLSVYEQSVVTVQLHDEFISRPERTVIKPKKKSWHDLRSNRQNSLQRW